MKKKLCLWLVIIIAVITLPVCGASVIVNHGNWNWYNSQSQALFNRVAALKSFFAHASVGGNICDGLSSLHSSNAAKFPLIITDASSLPPGTTVAGNFYQFSRGNPGWQPKIDTFDSYVAGGWHAPAIDFAMNKLCYVDSDANASYCLSHHAALCASYASTKFIMCTMPLTTDESDNIARNNFNNAVRSYAASHSILLYDIADIEAYNPSNVQSTFTSGGVVYQKLYDGYTYDGGHPSIPVAEQRLATGLYSLIGLAISGSSGPYTVHFVAGSHGSISGNATQTVASGASCSAVSATADSDYHFVNWTGTGGFATSTANPLTVTNVTASMTITANFVANPLPQYTVNFVSGGHGSISGAASQTVEKGSNCTAVSAIADGGFHFVSWTGTGGFVTSMANPLTVTNVTANMTITANFTLGPSPTQTIALIAGWNWVSFQVEPSDLALGGLFAGVSGSIDQVKSQTHAAQYANGHWQGELIDMSGIARGVMYKVHATQACTLTISGAALPAEMAIDVEACWNWIGYLRPSAQTLNQVFSTILDKVQQVKSQTQSAIYQNNSWQGDLTQAEPGKGYMVYLSAPAHLLLTNVIER